MHGNAAVPCHPMRSHTVVVGTNILVAWFKERKAQLTNLGCLLIYPDLACCRQIQPQHKSPHRNGIPAKCLLIVTTRMILRSTGASNPCIALAKLETSNYFKFQTHRWRVKSICTGERAQIAPQSWIDVFRAFPCPRTAHFERSRFALSKMMRMWSNWNVAEHGRSTSKSLLFSPVQNDSAP